MPRGLADGLAGWRAIGKRQFPDFPTLPNSVMLCRMSEIVSFAVSAGFWGQVCAQQEQCLVSNFGLSFLNLSDFIRRTAMLDVSLVAPMLCHYAIVEWRENL